MVGKTISHYRVLDSGVNWNRIAFEAPVIPAKAGIQSVGGAFPMACGRDSRFRGNDFAWERPLLANDTTTKARKRLNEGKRPDIVNVKGARNDCPFLNISAATAA